ncbi:MAG: hypothetical protein U0610_15570 [bacterium]
MNALLASIGVYGLASVSCAALAFACSRSTLQAFVTALGACTALWLAAAGFAAAGYERATLALAGPAASASIVLDPAAVPPAGLGADADPVARAWQLWLAGRLRVEPEPAFLAALRWLARSSPEGSLEWVRALSPHGPSV